MTGQQSCQLTCGSHRGPVLLQPVIEDSLDSFCLPAIQQFRHTPVLAAVVKHVIHYCEDLRPVMSDYGIGTLIDCNGPFRVLAQGDTGHADDRGFLLQPSRIRHDQPCTGY